MKTILFADDTTIYTSYNGTSDIISQFNVELEKLSSWFYSNRICINSGKTYALNFSLCRGELIDSNLKLNDANVDYVESGRFLGVFLDSKLTFKHHISHVCSKLSKVVGIFYRVFPEIPYHIRINLYYSLFYPHLLYCNLVWGETSETYLNNVFLLQKRVIRMICSEHFLAHTNELFYRTKILKLQDLHKFVLSTFFYKNSSIFNAHSH